MINKKQLKNRNKIAKQLLGKEIALSTFYRDELEDESLGLSLEEQAYKKRVVKAVDRMFAVESDELASFVGMKFIDNCTMQEVCDALCISQSTYYVWRSKVIRDFSVLIGIPV